ncbi:O-acyltransferase like protein-like isoform X2 [Ischnura elegans]|nr:O-acyltransferase like protein-like isoform X2 [Ischnura elegans]XP_046403520.1 O-acyltransferase like protein-like isoform X2 [Ischnura elegans]XP_046403521.1 O-acyltransferase like protein-like isoform X2 [Ischnura elegans]
MYDAGGKFPRGIITSITNHGGNHYDCIEVERRNDGGIKFQGQYCVVPIEVFEGESTNGTTYSYSSFGFTHHYIRPPKLTQSPQLLTQRNLNWTDLKELFWATCIPSTCSNAELEKAVNTALAEAVNGKNLVIHATVKTIDCATTPMRDRTLFEYMFFLTFFCLCIICLASSVYDCYAQPRTNDEGKSPGLLVNVFLGFSLKRNFNDLVAEPSKSDGLRILYGIRVISALFIIAFHRMLLTGFASVLNPDFIISIRNKPSAMLFRNGEMAVDTFFTISAFLHILSMYRQQGKFSFLKTIFRRYMRLTPVALVAIFTEIVMIDNMMGYPLWKHAKHLIQRPCTRNWIANMLYISNFKAADEMCLVNAWYLGADMQLYVLSIPVILLVIKYSSVAKYVFGALAFVSIAIPFAVALVSDAPPVLLSIIDRRVHPLVRSHVENLYWPTYCRAGSYIVGLIAGYLYHHIQLKKFKLSETLSRSFILLTISFVCCFVPLYYSTSFHDKGYSYTPLESALFVGFNRFLWGVGVGLFILVIATRAEGFLHKFLGHKFFIFLGKITYSSLLANLVINVYFLGASLQPIYLSISYYVTSSILDIFFTYILGFFIYLFIEQPFRNLSELICSGFKTKSITTHPAKKSE